MWFASKPKPTPQQPIDMRTEVFYETGRALFRIFLVGCVVCAVIEVPIKLAASVKRFLCRRSQASKESGADDGS